MNIFGRYKFSDKVHSPIGIMSAILGCIALVSSLIATVTPYLIKAPSSVKYAMVLVLSFIMAIVGIILSFIGKSRKGEYGLFPKIGLLLNAAVVLWCLFIIVIGAGII